MANHVFADRKASFPPVNPAPGPVPRPWRNPPVMELAEVIGEDAVRQIEASGQLVFHAVGDTAGFVIQQESCGSIPMCR